MGSIRRSGSGRRKIGLGVAGGVVAVALGLGSTGAASGITVSEILDALFGGGTGQSQGDSNSGSHGGQDDDRGSGSSTEATTDAPDSGAESSPSKPASGDNPYNLVVLDTSSYSSDVDSLRDAKEGQSDSSTEKENPKAGGDYDRGAYQPDGGQDGGSFPSKVQFAERYNNPDITSKCSPRDAQIIRQADGDITWKNQGSCKIGAGTNVTDPYGWKGEHKTYTTTDTGSLGRNAMDIDHVVPLGEVNYSGGNKLSDEQKYAVANDPDNLILASASANRSKSDKDVTQFLPEDPETACVYLSHYVKIKKDYNLSVTGAERVVLKSEGEKCGF